jgi:hypothetical protein
MAPIRAEGGTRRLPSKTFGINHAEIHMRGSSRDRSERGQWVDGRGSRRSRRPAPIEIEQSQRKAACRNRSPITWSPSL